MTPIITQYNQELCVRSSVVYIGWLIIGCLIYLVRATGHAASTFQSF